MEYSFFFSTFFWKHIDLNSAEIIANCIQIDNMMPGTEFPVLLQPKYTSSKNILAGMTGEETKVTEDENERNGVSASEMDLPCFNAVVVQRKSEGYMRNFFFFLSFFLMSCDRFFFFFFDLTPSRDPIFDQIFIFFFSFFSFFS